MDGEIVVARRRQWTAEEKAALMAEVEAEGGQVSVVAHRHGISKSLLLQLAIGMEGRWSGSASQSGPADGIRSACRTMSSATFTTFGNQYARTREAHDGLALDVKARHETGKFDGQCEDREGSSSAVGHAWTERREGCCDPVVPIDLPRPLIGGSRVDPIIRWRDREWLLRVEPRGSIAVPRTAGIGASRPLPCVPAKVFSLIT